MIITISGTAGAGKSTVAKEVAKRLDLKHYSNGDFMREIAQKKGVTVLELNKIAETDKSIDKELDDRLVKLGKEENNFVIDSRLGFHFIPSSFKVFLDAGIHERATRVFGDQRGTEDNITLHDTKDKMIEREKSESVRYSQLYGVNHLDYDNYDLVVDTTHMTVKEVVEKVLGKINSLP